jgi:4'-phosphopantetheinyl transferase
VRVEVWWARTDGRRVEDWPDLLAAAEPTTRQRIERLVRPDDRVTTLLAHHLARAGAADRLGIACSGVRIERRCPVCGGDEHGRPEAVTADGADTSCQLSISHTRELAVVAIGGSDPVGVDAEAATVGDWATHAHDVFGPAELRSIEADPSGLVGRRLWARKEALAKLAGVGLTVPFSGIDVSGTPAAGGYVDGPAAGWVRDIEVQPDHAVALACPRPVESLTYKRFGS